MTFSINYQFFFFFFNKKSASAKKKEDRMLNSNSRCIWFHFWILFMLRAIILEGFSEIKQARVVKSEIWANFVNNFLRTYLLLFVRKATQVVDYCLALKFAFHFISTNRLRTTDRSYDDFCCFRQLKCLINEENIFSGSQTAG